MPRRRVCDGVDGIVTERSDQNQMRQSSRAAKKQWEENTEERRKLGMKKATIKVCNLYHECMLSCGVSCVFVCVMILL
jgi:hypothetical protein